MTARRRYPAFSALGLLVLLALPASADPRPLPEQARNLATCEGRYSAVLHYSGLSPEQSEGARLRRDLFAAMLDALVASDDDPKAMDRQALRLRIAQQRITKRLLESVRYSDDPKRVRIARNKVTQALAACDMILTRNRRLAI